MTLSPGQKVQPKRSTRISPGGFNAVCSSMLRERAPRPPRFIGHSTWMSYGIEPEALRDTLPHDSQPLSDAFFWVRRVDKIEVAAVSRRKLWHKALVDAMGIDDDPALGSLAEDLGQAHDRRGTRCDDVGQHLPGPDRRQLIDVADEQQCGLVRQGAQ